jgi:penicillin-binding protein activator
MNVSLFIRPLLLTAAVVATGCQSAGPPSKNVGRIDMDKDDSLGGTGTESGDIRAMSDKFVRSLLENKIIANAKGTPTVALLSVKNDVNDATIRIDTDMILLKMKTDLSKAANGKIVFLDRAKLDDVKKEHAAKDEGDVTRSSKRAIYGADYFMTGTVKSLTKSSAEGKTNYLYYEFHLTDAETTAEVWIDDYEQKRQDVRGVNFR